MSVVELNEGFAVYASLEKFWDISVPCLWFRALNVEQDANVSEEIGNYA